MSAAAHAGSPAGDPSGAEVRVYDPFVPSLATKAGVFTSAESIEVALSGADCAVFLVDHDVFRRLDTGYIGSCMNTPVLVDCKNLFQQKDGIVYLCIGKGE